MAGVAGILNIDGAPVDPDALRKMAEAMRYRGPDGVKAWRQGPVGLAHCHFWTTPEDVGEEQPISSADGRYTITADARIDNRDELIPFLAAKGFLEHKAPTDAQVILAAYACWGEDCARHLIGDFAFGLWDSEKRRLLLVRDVIGIRQMYYASEGRKLVFGSSVGAVLAGLDDVPPLNRPLIEAFLWEGGYQWWICETVYSGLLRLPPAHYLAADRGDASSPHLYYVLGSDPQPQLGSDREWIERFRSLLDQAVSSRLRATSPIGISVSGGFDSSAVACVAKALVDRGAISQSVRLYSMVYPETPAADESAYFDAIARHCNGFPAVHVISNGYWGLRDMGPEDVFPLDEPDLYPTRGHLLSFFRRAADDDCRVLLLGEGGDHVLSRNLYLRLDAVRGLPWRHLLPEFAHALWWGRHAYSTGGYLARLAYSYVTRQLPEPVMGRLRHLRKSLRRRPPWLLSDGSSQQKPCALDERFFCPSGLDPAGQAVHRSIRRPYEITRHSPLDVVAAFAMIEPRSPFWDRRLVDFMLGVPRHLRGWRGVDRLIAREALRGVLPEEVRQRVRKGDISPIVHLGLREKERLQVESLLRGSCAEKLGFINALALYNDIYLPYVAGATDDYQPWLRAIYLEVWLRKRHLAMANDLKGAP